MKHKNLSLKIICTLLILSMSGIPASAVELIMFHSPVCEWCEVWEEEVGVIYSETTEGKFAKLKRISIHSDRPENLKNIKGVNFTPTFVLIDKNKEIGRIVGYPGEAFFWGLLENLLIKVPGYDKFKKQS